MPRLSPFALVLLTDCTSLAGLEDLTFEEGAGGAGAPDPCLPLQLGDTAHVGQSETAQQPQREGMVAPDGTVFLGGVAPGPIRGR